MIERSYYNNVKDNKNKYYVTIHHRDLFRFKLYDVFRTRKERIIY